MVWRMWPKVVTLSPSVQRCSHNDREMLLRRPATGDEKKLKFIFAKLCSSSAHNTPVWNQKEGGGGGGLDWPTLSKPNNPTVDPFSQWRRDATLFRLHVGQRPNISFGSRGEEIPSLISQTWPPHHTHQARGGRRPGEGVSAANVEIKIHWKLLVLSVVIGNYMQLPDYLERIRWRCTRNRKKYGKVWW